jgi:hypothetical protein
MSKEYVKFWKGTTLPSSRTSDKLYFDTNKRQVYLGSTKVAEAMPETIDGGEWVLLKDGSCCFFPGTQILLSNGTTKNIELMSTGDKVISFDILTQSYYEAEVKSLIVNRDTTDIAIVIFEDDKQLQMNAYHPLLTPDGFHSLTNHEGYETLVMGDLVKDIELEWNKISLIERFTLESPMTTYNLDIKNIDEMTDDDTNDTFIANGLVVHNASCPT